MSFISGLKNALKSGDSSGKQVLRINTFIGKRTTVDGSLVVIGNTKIDGIINGPVKVTGDLVVGEDGRIEGDISANNIIIAGTVTGSITAKGQLAVKQTAVVEGDHTSHSLIIEEGSVFRGRCDVLETIDERP